MKTLEILTQLINGNHLEPKELKEAQNTVSRLQSEIDSRKPAKIEFTRVNNDTNGNPRYVCHFLSIPLTEEEQKQDISTKYRTALNKSREIGGKKFHNKQFGGGISFQSYNIQDTEKEILSLK